LPGPAVSVPDKCGFWAGISRPASIENDILSSNLGTFRTVSRPSRTSAYGPPASRNVTGNVHPTSSFRPETNLARNTCATPRPRRSAAQSAQCAGGGRAGPERAAAALRARLAGHAAAWDGTLTNAVALIVAHLDQRRVDQRLWKLIPTRRCRTARKLRPAATASTRDSGQPPGPPPVAAVEVGVAAMYGSVRNLCSRRFGGSSRIAGMKRSVSGMAN
jgi:hypothetical protein